MDDRRLIELSAALDGEAEMPDDLSPDEARFVAAAERVRRSLRIEEAATPPDVAAAVLDRIDQRKARPLADPPSRPRSHLWLAAAAVFVVAALAASLAVRPGGPAAPGVAGADVGDRILEGQLEVTHVEASVTLTERGVHPDVPERVQIGTLRYEAPERLHVEITEVDPAPGWPANDAELLLDDGTAVVSGLDACPVGEQPACLDRDRVTIVGLAPFAQDRLEAFDLVVPTSAFLPSVATSSRTENGTVVVDATAARVERLVEAVTSLGAVRDVHPTDRVSLELDAKSLLLRRLVVRAAGGTARTTWAATNGYFDEEGSVVLDLELTPARLGPPTSSPALAADAASGGFTDGTLDRSWPTPDGFSPHRSGVLADGGPLTEVQTFHDGRAWIRVDVTRAWDEPRLFGGLGPIVRPLRVGEGTGYTDPGGRVVSLHTDELDVVVSGSVKLETLIDVAGSILTGEPIDGAWEQARHVDEVPHGALVPPVEHVAVLDDGELLVAIGGPGGTGVVISQRPGTRLDPPPKGDVVEAPVRDTVGRYTPRLGTLTWVEDGWIRAVRAPGLDLAGLSSVANSLGDP